MDSLEPMLKEKENYKNGLKRNIGRLLYFLVVNINMVDRDILMTKGREIFDQQIDNQDVLSAAYSGALGSEYGVIHDGSDNDMEIISRENEPVEWNEGYLKLRLPFKHYGLIYKLSI